MALTVNGAAGNPLPNYPMLDVIESFNGPGLGTATTVGVYNRGYAPSPIANGNTLAGVIFPTAALGTIAVDAVSGLVYVRATGTGARQNRHASSSLGKMPLSKRYGAVGSLPASLSPPLLRYTWSIPVRSAVLGNVIEIGMAVSNGGLTGLGTTQAFVWSSDSARSAGAWEPRYRLTNAGAIQNGTVTSDIPDAVNYDVLGIRYTEGATPTIEWLLNDVPRFTLSGESNMPDLTAATAPFVPYIGLNAGAARVMDYLASRLIVEEV